MSRKLTLPTTVTNPAIKKTATVIRGFREFLADSVVEIALFINRQAGLIGFNKTDVLLLYPNILLSVFCNTGVLEFTILPSEQVAYEHWTPGGYIVTLGGLNLKQAIDELKKVKPNETK